MCSNSALDGSLDEANRWSWSAQRPCMQAYNGGRSQGGTRSPGMDSNGGSSKLQYPGPRTGAAIWTAPCCMVGGGPKSNQLNHKMCNAVKYKNVAGKCAHGSSDTVFMFGGIGLMESPARTNAELCLVDQPGAYVRGGEQQTASWVQSNSTKSWLLALDWELYETLCDLWQTDQANRWSLLGACAHGLQSPVNDFVPQSFEVAPTNPVPFPDALSLAGVYKASSWSDDVGKLWLFGGFFGSPAVGTNGLMTQMAKRFSPGTTVCNNDLWVYDPVKGGSWSNVRPATPRPANTLVEARPPTAHDVGSLPAFTWPQLGKCGAIAWQPWYRPLYRDSGAPQVCRCPAVYILARLPSSFAYWCMSSSP